MGVVVQGSSMLHSCAASGCSTLTLGRFCVAHEPVGVSRQFVRGRPFVQAMQPSALTDLSAQLVRVPRKLPG